MGNYRTSVNNFTGGGGGGDSQHPYGASASRTVMAQGFGSLA